MRRSRRSRTRRATCSRRWPRRPAVGPRELRVDGGATENDFLCQFQADILGLPILRPRVRETTALGAAYLAGLGAGLWRGPEALHDLWQLDRALRARPCPPARRDALYAGWRRAVDRARGWAREEAVTPVPPVVSGIPSDGPGVLPSGCRSIESRGGSPFAMSSSCSYCLTASLAVPAAAQAPIEDELVLQTPVSKFIVDAALKAFADYAKEKWGVHGPDERPVRRDARLLRTDRRVEGQARGRHLLGRRVSPVRQAGGAEAPGQARGAAGARRDAIPAGLGKPKAIPLKDPDRVLGRDDARAVRPGLPPAAHPAAGRAGAEGLGRSPPSEAQGPRRPVRADPLLLEPRDVRDHPPEPRRSGGLAMAEASRRQLRRLHRPEPRRARRSWPRGSSRPASRCPRTWRSRRCWPASTSSSSRRRTPS